MAAEASYFSHSAASHCLAILDPRVLRRGVAERLDCCRERFGIVSDVRAPNVVALRLALEAVRLPKARSHDLASSTDRRV